MEYPAILAEHSSPVWSAGRWFGSATLEFTHSYHHFVANEIGMHENEFYELNIVVDGVGRHYVGASAFEAVPGCAFMVPPRVRHGYFAASRMDVFHALIKNEFFKHYEMELASLPGFTMFTEIGPYMQTMAGEPIYLRLRSENYQGVMGIVNALADAEKSRYPGREVIKNARMIELMGLLAEYTSTSQFKQSAETDAYSPIIAEIMEYIRLNSNLKITVEELAARAHMSRASFMRHFGRICGATPIAFLMQCRVVHARKLLCYSDMPLTAISQECGFYDSSHFIRAFVAHEGINPSDYRTLRRRDADYSVCSLCAGKRGG